jgi:hypothetical protein
MDWLRYVYIVRNWRGRICLRIYQLCRSGLHNIGLVQNRSVFLLAKETTAEL